MKKISVIISIVLVVCISLIACSDAQSQPYQDNTLCESAISALESQIHQLQQEQDAFNAENQKKFCRSSHFAVRILFRRNFECRRSRCSKKTLRTNIVRFFWRNEIKE